MHRRTWPTRTGVIVTVAALASAGPGGFAGALGSAGASTRPAGSVVRGFVAPTVRYGSGHLGIDLATAPGAAVRALRPGTVVFAGRIGAAAHVTVRLADGRVYTGRQALAAKLIDELGGEERAIAWLEAQEDFPAGLKVSDWAPAGAGELSGLGFSIGRGMARAFGLEGLADRAAIHKLDGLLVLWHPAR